MGRQVRTQEKQPGPQPANPDGPIYSKPMPGAPHTWEPPGLQELLTVPEPRVLRMGLPPPTDILDSPHLQAAASSAQRFCSGWDMSSGVRGKGREAQRHKPEGLCWHTALESQPTNGPFTKALVV